MRIKFSKGIQISLLWFMLYESGWAYDIRSFAGGCTEAPTVPNFARMKCSAVSGCRIKCLDGYKFHNHELLLGLSTNLEMICRNGRWSDRFRMLREGDPIPDCEPQCNPPCRNEGICTSPNQCLCKEEFEGTHCELVKDKPCLSSPLHLPENAVATCSSRDCNVTCLDQHEFPNGIQTLKIACQNGDWVLPHSHAMPDCKPICNPPCKNDGVCLSMNQCRCLADYRGDRCQYHNSVCKQEDLNFNGNIFCKSNTDTFVCKLKCPVGIAFSFTPAPEYVCDYKTGTFSPQVIPKCIYMDGTEITGHFQNSRDSIQRMVRRASRDESGSLASGDPDRWKEYMKKRGNHSTPSSIEDKIAGYFSPENNDLSWLQEADAIELSEAIAKTSAESPRKKSSCMLWSGSHLRTFDGITFTVDLRNRILAQADNINTFKLWLNEKKELTFTTGESGDHPYELTLAENGKPVLKFGNETHPIPGVAKGLVLELVADKLVFLNILGLGLKVKWNLKDQISIEANENLWNGTLEGLCGNFDGNPLTDFRLQNGETANNIDELYDNWSVEGMAARFGGIMGHTVHPCPLSSEVSDRSVQFCGKILTEPRLESCHHVINGYSFYQTCRWDYCAGDIERACRSVELFASWCQDYGNVDLSTGWRSPDFCPFKCELGLEYQVCGSGESLTCQDAATYREEDHVQVTTTPAPIKIVTYSGFTEEDEHCIEGCYCPKGTFLHEGHCIAKNKCPCTFNGIEFLPGQTIVQECNQCQCEAGNWVCTEKLCGRTCSLFGHNHITTFDGKSFAFNSKGTFFLLKSEDIIIIANTCKASISSGYLPPPPSSTKISFLKIVAFLQEIIIRDDFQVSVNGVLVTQWPYTLSLADENKIFITKETSTYIGVSFSNGMRVSWNGQSQAYIHAPASASGTVKGLCGNYNKIQKDDFETPGGEVETTNEAFVNSWFTDFCDSNKGSLNAKLISCQLSPEKQSEAENYCATLKSDIFKECHWAVDPDAFYKTCLADICQCQEHETSKCLCPILSHYTQVCAEKGVYLDKWRQAIAPCALSCESGQRYSVCHTECYRTCADISGRSGACNDNVCVDGCACPEGEALDEHNNCIPVSKCPCRHFSSGENVETGEVRYHPRNTGNEHCTCSGGEWKCRPLKNDEERQKMKNQFATCDKSKNLVLRKCYNSFQQKETCDNMHKSLPEVNTTSCDVGGCVCREGFVFPDEDSTACIPKDKCPCHHGGKSYQEGNKIQQDCNTCICRSGHWTCTQRICSSICSAWGDSHYITFDGKMYDFKGKCEYILAQFTGSNKDAFQVLIQNVPCGTSDVTCSKRITIKIGEGKSKEKITLAMGTSLPPEGSFKRITTRKAGLFTFVDVYDLGLTVQWDGSNRVYVRIKPSWKGQVKGLCGNANDDQEDDFKGPSGITETFPAAFADSWKIHKYCPAATEAEDGCGSNPERRIWSTTKCSVLHSETFKPCHSEVDWEPWYQMCLSDACGCNVGGDCECLCTAIAAYAHECTRAGVPVLWRNQHLCPMQCPHESAYESCIATCPTKTCQDILFHKANSLSCENEYCVEGCQPDRCSAPDHVYISNEDFTCVPPSRCPKTKCLIHRGILYYEGDTIEMDECHNCTCSRGQRLCTYSDSPQCESTTVGYTTISPYDESSTSSSLVTLNNTNITVLPCNEGWSSWINSDSPTLNFPNDEEDINEFLNSTFDLRKGYCSKDTMVDIECRSAVTHKSARSTHLFTVECDLKKGLLCRLNDPSHVTQLCEDFEYRVLCRCITSELNKTTTLKYCDPMDPPLAVKDQCNLYKECLRLPIGSPPKYEVKSCEDGLLYNPVDATCDWPDKVRRVRTDCKEDDATQGTPANTTVCDSEPYVPNVPHETDCSLFYHCYHNGLTPSEDHHRKAELKSCGPGTIFNTKTMICDWPHNVIPLRPECGDDKSTSDISSTGSLSTTTPLPVPITEEEEEEGVCSKTSTFSLLEHPEADLKLSVSSILPSKDLHSAKLYAYKEPSPEDFIVKWIETKTADKPDAGMNEEPSIYTDSEYYVELCSDKGCCSVDKLDNGKDDAFKRNQVDTFHVEDIGECANFDLGGDDVPKEVKVTHAGTDEGELDYITVVSEDGKTLKCEIGEELAGSVTKTYPCKEDKLLETKPSTTFTTVKPPSNKFELNKVVAKTSAEPGSDVGNEDNPYFNNGYGVEICGSKTCCNIEDLDNAEDNWELGKKDIFKDRDIEACSNVDLGDEGKEPEIKLTHKGTDPGKLEDIKLVGKDGKTFKCEIGVKMEGDITKSFSCEEEKPEGDDCWTPTSNDKNQYFQVKFSEPKEIYGFMTQGGGGDDFVKTYHVLVGEDENSISHIEDDFGRKKVFNGNTDGTTVQTAYLNPTISAKLVRFVPLTWNNNICFKSDIIGCVHPEKDKGIEDEITTPKPKSAVSEAPGGSTTPKDICFDEMGISQGSLSKHQIAVSSVLNNNHYRYGKQRLAFSEDGSWRPAVNDKHQYAILDFTDSRLISGVILKGDEDSYIKSFKIEYSSDGHHWEKIRDKKGKEKIFNGNHNGQSKVERFFDRMIRMNYLKITPESWTPSGIALKLEILGCFEPYISPTSTPISYLTTPGYTTPGYPGGGEEGTPKCDRPCPNLPFDEYSIECRKCTENQKWNGTRCIHPLECACYEGHIRHEVGAHFSSENCESCICLPGGSLKCSPKKCPPCYGEDEYPYVTPLCGCLCKSCAKNERLCRTSNLCIPAEKWCDGVQDCADDETNCDEPSPRVTSTTPSPSGCPPDPTCPPGARLRQTEIESPLGCVLSKCECLDPVCPEGYTIKYDSKKDEKLSSKPMRMEFANSESSSSYSTNELYEESIASEALLCPKYRCVPPPEIVECFVDGHSVQTFDKFKYKLSTCHHTLASNISGSWNVTTHKICGVECEKSLKIEHDKNLITLNQDLSVEYNNVQYTPNQASKLSSDLGFKIRLIGDSNLIFESLKYPLRVSWSKFGRAEIRTDTTGHNEVVGICGKFDGDSKNDLTKPDGEVADNVEDFGESWVIEGTPFCENRVCPMDRQRRALEICNTVKYPPFNRCKDILDMRSIIAQCVEETCVCLNKTDDDIRTCRCEAQTEFVNQCLRVDRTLDLSEWRIIHFCPADCPAGKIMRDCHDASCQPKCGEPVKKCKRDPEAICFSGCFCSDDDVLSSDGSTCIPKETCKDCVCEGLGHSKIKNFDGKEFEFPGNCSYVAVKHDQGDFEVHITNHECPDDVKSFCVVSIAVQTSDKVLRVVKDENNSEGVILYENDQVAPSINHKTKWFKSTSSPAGNVFLKIFRFNLEIIFKKDKGAFAVKYSSFTHGGKTSGLCGNCNDDDTDDIVMRDKNPTDDILDFGNSWATKSCPKPKVLELPAVETCLNEDNEVCDRLKGETFASCHPFIPVDRYVSKCKRSFCKRTNYTLCKAFEEYAKACFEEGELCVSWREKEHCPKSLKCPVYLEYKECVTDACEKTCDDVISSLIDISTHASEEPTSSSYGVKSKDCDMIEPEGCYCPDGKVRNKDRECVYENYCHVCTDKNGTEHHLEEQWKPDPCQICTCTESGTVCTVVKCSTIPCPVGHEVQAHHVEGECCPSQTCVAVKKNCTIVKTPQCGKDYRLKKLELSGEDCPTFVCECLPREECPELEPEEPLEPGEQSTVRDNGCCLHRTKVCKSDTCPPPPDCPAHHKLKKLTKKCCQSYECEPPNACIDEFHGHLRQVGDHWNEGACKNCTCVKKPNAKKPESVCTMRTCDDILAEDKDYIFKTITVQGECCPKKKRTQCKHDEEIFSAGEWKKENKDGVCKIFKCKETKTTDGVEKSLEMVEFCDSNCPLGSEYVKAPDFSDKHCCGRCVPYACASGNKLYEVGNNYTDGCITRSCHNENGTLLLAEKSKECPSVENCPMENIIRDTSGCCMICNGTSAATRDCTTVEFDPSETVGLVKEIHSTHGKCRNKKPIANYRQCYGHCESKTVYLSPLDSHSSDCKCCQVRETKSIPVYMSCDNGYTYEKRISVPSKCDCLECAGEENEGTSLTSSLPYNPYNQFNIKKTTPHPAAVNGYDVAQADQSITVPVDQYDVTHSEAKDEYSTYDSSNFFDKLQRLPTDQAYSKVQQNPSSDYNYDIGEILGKYR